MKKMILTAVLLITFAFAYSQVDTISQNLYQYYGRIGIGRVNTGGYFNPSLAIHNGWFQVTDSTNHDAGLVVAHLHRTGYGFARNVNMVYEGVNGDPYTEFRIRENNDYYTASSWSIGSCNLEDDKLIISNDINTNTGASPSIGYRVVTMKLSGEVGIGTSEPYAKLQVTDGDIFISDIERGIIMKSPDGRCWRGTLDLNGTLKFSVLDCPDFTTSVYAFNQKDDDIMIYPNPANDKVFIELKNTDHAGNTYSINDLSGKAVVSGQINSDFITIDLSSYLPGTYIINILDSSGTILSSEKIIRK